MGSIILPCGDNDPEFEVFNFYRISERSDGRFTSSVDPVGSRPLNPLNPLNPCDQRFVFFVATCRTLLFVVCLRVTPPVLRANRFRWGDCGQVHNREATRAMTVPRRLHTSLMSQEMQVCRPKARSTRARVA